MNVNLCVKLSKTPIECIEPALDLCLPVLRFTVKVCYS